MRGPKQQEADKQQAVSLTRRLLLRCAALTGIATSLIARNHSTKAAVCAPRGAGCSTLQPCCDGSPCRVFGSNPFVGLCPGHGAIAQLRRSGTLWAPALNRRTSDVTCEDFRTLRQVRRFLRRNPGFDRSRLEDERGRLCRELRGR